MSINGTGLRTRDLSSVANLRPPEVWMQRLRKNVSLRGFELMGISLIEVTVVRSNADGDTLSRGRGMGGLPENKQASSGNERQYT